MKHLWIAVAIFVLALGSCKTSTGPEASQPALMPAVPSEYTYAVVRQAFAGHSEVRLIERDSIISATNDRFDVVRHSDTINAFSTAMGHDRYQVIAPGDLRVLGVDTDCFCDSTALPIATHKSYDPSGGGLPHPAKKNGVIGSITPHTQYDEMESVQAAGETFLCTKVEKRVTLIASSGNAGIPADTTVITHVYWYSPKIQFFVKDQLISSDSLSFTRTLTSYKLGK